MSQEGGRQIFLFDILASDLYNEISITKKGARKCQKDSIKEINDPKNPGRTGREDLFQGRRQGGIRTLRPEAALSRR